MGNKISFFLFRFFTYSFLLVPVFSYSQNTYVKTVGSFHSDFGTSCKLTYDKGSILSLVTSTNGMDVHTGLVKADYNGNLQWTKLFQIGNWCVSQNVLQTPDSGYMVFGMATDSLVINLNNSYLFLLKTDSLGNELWIKEYPVSSNDLAVGLIRSKSGGYIASSVTDYNVGSYPLVCLTRFDESGNVVWQQQYSAPYGLLARGITELSNGNICFVSNSGSFSSFWFNDVLVSETDSTGNLLWTKSFSTYYDDEANAIATNSADELFITGRSYIMGREWDSFLLKLDANGNKLLSKFYDAGTYNGEIMRCLNARDDGSCTLLGDMGTFDERDITLLDINPNGDIHWAKRFPFSPLFTNYPYEMYTTYDSGFVFTGDVRPPSYARDAALVKTDKDGNTSCFNSTANFTTLSDTFQVMNVTLNSFSSTVNSHPATSTVPSNFFLPRLICENPLPVPDFSFFADTVCPAMCLAFHDNSLNQPTSWLWEFTGADSSTSAMQNPGSICYPQPGDYLVRLTVTNSFGTTSIAKIIHLQYHCPDTITNEEEPLFIPNVFTPNSDNFNDEFIIKGLPDEFLLRIFNRWGQELFNSSDKLKSWRGKAKNNSEVPEGVYFYELLLSDRKLNGVVQLIR